MVDFVRPPYPCFKTSQINEIFWHRCISPSGCPDIFVIRDRICSSVSASAVRVGCKSGLGAGSRPGERGGNDIYQKVVRNRSARVLLCKYLGLDHEQPRNFSF